MEDKLVSVGIPLRNEERFLPKTLECLLGQTYQNIEFVILDNSSEDRTPEICEEFRRKDKRIKVFRSDSFLYPHESFEKVLHLCSGEYFMWAAGHDLWEKNYVEVLKEILDEHKDCVIAYGKTFVIDEKDNFMFSYPLLLDTRSVKNVFLRFHITLYNLEKGVSIIYGLMRREFALKCKMLPSWGPDFLFILQMSFWGSFYQTDRTKFFMRRTVRDWKKKYIPSNRARYLGINSRFPLIDYMMKCFWVVLNSSQAPAHLKILMLFDTLRFYMAWVRKLNHLGVSIFSKV